MKSYGEIDPDEAPIVVLGCGHFLTAETLDGLMGMREVYMVEASLLDSKTCLLELAQSIPCCSDC